MATILTFAVLLVGVTAQSPPYGQCGGIGWTGPTTCTAGWFCQVQGTYFSQCAASPIPPGDQVPFGQCAGLGYVGLTQCSPGYFCNFQDIYYSQCILVPYTAPGSNRSAIASTSTSSFTSRVVSSSSVTTTLPVSVLSSSKTSSSLLKTSSTSTSQILASSTLKSTSLVNTLLSTTRSSSTTSSQKLSSPSTSFKSTSSSTLSSVKLTTTLFSSTKLSSTSVSSTQVSSSKSSSTFSTSVVSSSKISSSSTLKSSSTSTTPLSCATFNPPPPSAGKVQFTGINIPGCEFGGNSDGYQTPTGGSGAYCPLGPTYGLPNGPGQMAHFASQDKFNMFRLPVGWQFITNSQYTAVSTLDPTTSAQYDFLVQSCLATGAYCLIDFHNFARFNGGIIGQGGPSDAVWAATWAAIAAKYKNQSKVVFGLMNEPHDLPSITAWAASCQAAVTAIRNAGATTQIILLPGNDWTSAQSFVTDGSGPALAKVTNPDGSFTNLVFDWDAWLRCNGRQVLLSEIGGGSVASCELYVCQAVAYLNANSDVYLGYLGWAAGSFDTSYILAETPTNNNGIWTDTQIVTQCLVPH